MRIFLAILINDIKLYFRDWKAVAFIILLPALAVAFFSSVLAPWFEKGRLIEPFPIAVVDNENSPQTRIIVKQLENIGLFKPVFVISGEDAKQKLLSGEIPAMIIIPEGFTNSIVFGGDFPIAVEGSSAQPLKATIVRKLAENAANLVSSGQAAIEAVYHFAKEAGLQGSELDWAINKAASDIILEMFDRTKVIELINSGSADSGSTPAEYFTAALMAVFLMFASIPAISIFADERDYGISRRLSASPAGYRHLLPARLITFMMAALLQLLFIIIFTSLVFHSYWGAPVASILAIFAPSLLAAAAFALLVAALAPDRAASNMAGYLGTFLLAITAGNIYPLTFMPPVIRYLSRFTPGRWVMEGFMAIFSGERRPRILHPALNLLAISGVMLLVAFVVFYIRDGKQKRDIRQKWIIDNKWTADKQIEV
ncbi:MAG: ABC transporter permease [Clostridiales bacterium]|nr:ABC transporter permease [Clostridiales bacterium]